MNFNFNINFLNSVNSTFKHMLYESHKAQEIVGACEGLSTIQRRNHNANVLYNQHMNRICNVVDYLINSDPDSQEVTLENFEIENLIREIVNRFEETVSGYTPVSIDLTINLKGTNSILLSKAHFELVVLNLLYCCIKTKSNEKSRTVKISISVTENKNDVVFHIRDNNKTIDIDEINTSFETSSASFKNIDTLSFATLIALSLKAAQKSATEMNGSLVCTPLKQGNRYDLHLPKIVNTPIPMLCSPVPYVPTYTLYNEFFADLKLEALKKVISCLEEEPEF